MSARLCAPADPWKFIDKKLPNFVFTGLFWRPFTVLTNGTESVPAQSGNGVAQALETDIS